MVSCPLKLLVKNARLKDLPILLRGLVLKMVMNLPCSGVSQLANAPGSAEETLKVHVADGQESLRFSFRGGHPSDHRTMLL